jgi:hypothetical protein
MANDALGTSTPTATRGARRFDALTAGRQARAGCGECRGGGAAHLDAAFAARNAEDARPARHRRRRNHHPAA